MTLRFRAIGTIVAVRVLTAGCVDMVRWFAAA